MKKFICLASLLLLASCANNDQMKDSDKKQQQTPMPSGKCDGSCCPRCKTPRPCCN